MESDNLYPKTTKELIDKRTALAPETMEAIWVAEEMRSGGAYAHSVIALDEMD
ncbi:MAG: hypothetical protein JJE18_08835 [Eubacteriaceae bacterium]|nr:hypothetical protein [Eubacteriaceae bacterium]